MAEALQAIIRFGFEKLGVNRSSKRPFSASPPTSPTCWLSWQPQAEPTEAELLAIAVLEMLQGGGRRGEANGKGETAVVPDP